MALQAIGQGFESPYLQRQEAGCAAESAVAETNVPRDFLAVSRVGPVSARLCEQRLTMRETLVSRRINLLERGRGMRPPWLTAGASLVLLHT